jgi:hypothetical protein
MTYDEIRRRTLVQNLLNREIEYVFALSNPSRHAKPVRPAAWETV